MFSNRPLIRSQRVSVSLSLIELFIKMSKDSTENKNVFLFPWLGFFLLDKALWFYYLLEIFDLLLDMWLTCQLYLIFFI